MTIKELTNQEKLSLLKELFEDDYVKPFIQAEFEIKLERALQRFDQQIEEYVKRKDAEINRARHNMWHQTVESWVEQGVGEACAKFKRIMKELKELPFDSYQSSVLKDIHDAKNRIMDNSLSRVARGRRAFHTLLRYEGAIADILEHMWSYAFDLGMKTRYRALTDEEIKKLDDEERETRDEISRGAYDKGRILMEVERYISTTEEERRVNNAMHFTQNLFPLHPEEHPEIMDFISNL